MLVGRAKPEDPEVAATLKAFAALDVPVLYVPADVTSADDCMRVVDETAKKGWQIAGFVHGAARNLANEAASVVAEDGVVEMAPKVAGFRNMMAALGKRGGGASGEAPAQLDFVLCLSSIIGVTGMTASGVYGSSAETAVVALRYSHWAEVGMAAKMGSNDYLDSLGMSSIDVARGTELFVNHLGAALQQRGTGAPHGVVITSRMGSLSTWLAGEGDAASNLQLADKAASPMVDRLVSRLAHVESLAHVDVSVAKHRFLLDHVIRGTVVIPAVMLLDLAAQTLATIDGEAPPGALELCDVKFMNAIDVPSIGSETIAVHVIRSDDERALFEVRSESSDYMAVATQGTIKRQAADRPAVPSGLAAYLDKQDGFLPLEPRTDLYGAAGILFHGPEFQRIMRVFETVWDTTELFGHCIITLKRRTSAHNGALRPRRCCPSTAPFRPALRRSTFRPRHASCPRTRRSSCASTCGRSRAATASPRPPSSPPASSSDARATAARRSFSSSGRTCGCRICTSTTRSRRRLISSSRRRATRRPSARRFARRAGRLARRARRLPSARASSGT